MSDDKQLQSTDDNKKPVLAKDVGFWREIWTQTRLVWRLMSDGDVSPLLKVIPVAAAAYLFMPLDLIPDMALGLGQLDDLGVVLMGARLFTQLAPADLVDKHRRALAAEDGYGPADEDDLADTIIIEGEKE